MQLRTSLPLLLHSSSPSSQHPAAGRNTIKFYTIPPSRQRPRHFCATPATTSTTTPTLHQPHHVSNSRTPVALILLSSSPPAPNAVRRHWTSLSRLVSPPCCCAEFPALQIPNFCLLHPRPFPRQSILESRDRPLDASL
jgi:hypothetical protein